MKAHLLDILFSVESETQQGTKKVFRSVAGTGFDHVALELLGPKMRKRLRKRVAKPASEHDNELQNSQLFKLPCESARQRHATLAPQDLKDKNRT